MNTSNEFEQSKFDLFLNLLSPDRDEAGQRYEHLRARLIRFFEIRGCSYAEELADRTLARVTEKAHTFDPQRDVPFGSFVYGFASNILKEHRRSHVQDVSLEPNDAEMRSVEADEATEERLSLIENCLQTMAVNERELLLRYYSADNGRVAAERESLARDAGCSVSTLHTRAFRLRQKLANMINAGLK